MQCECGKRQPVPLAATTAISATSATALLAMQAQQQTARYSLWHSLLAVQLSHVGNMSHLPVCQPPRNAGLAQAPVARYPLLPGPALPLWCSPHTHLCGPGQQGAPKSTDTSPLTGPSTNQVAGQVADYVACWPASLLLLKMLYSDHVCCCSICASVHGLCDQQECCNEPALLSWHHRPS